MKRGSSSLFSFLRKIVKDFTKNLDEQVLVKDFTKNLDERRLKNIFLDFFRNLVYTLDTLKKK